MLPLTLSESGHLILEVDTWMQFAERRGDPGPEASLNFPMECRKPQEVATGSAVAGARAAVEERPPSRFGERITLVNERRSGSRSRSAEREPATEE